MPTDDFRSARLHLPVGYHFNEVKAFPSERRRVPLDFAAPLRVLARFTGTFVGRGFNMIFRPQNPATPTVLPTPPKSFHNNVLELNLTRETLSFSQGLGSVPNRGSVQGDIFLNGVPYVQTIQDVTEGLPVDIHFEPGIWLAVPATTDPPEPGTLVRLASIPHGTTINLQGTASPPIAGRPRIPIIDPTPFGANKLLVKQPSQETTAQGTSRIPQDLTAHAANGTITQAILNDPNTVLREAIDGQNIVETVTIDVASAPEIPAGPLEIPSEGGGTANIAFLVGTGLAKNADVPKAQGGSPFNIAGVRSTFWIETIEHVVHLPVYTEGQGPITLYGDSPPCRGLPAPIFSVHPPFPIHRPTTVRLQSTQIQYSQTVLLNFGGLSWPHVSVATLVPSDPLTPQPWVWEAPLGS